MNVVYIAGLSWTVCSGDGWLRGRGRGEGRRVAPKARSIVRSGDGWLRGRKRGEGEGSRGAAELLLCSGLEGHLSLTPYQGSVYPFMGFNCTAFILNPGHLMEGSGVRYWAGV